MNSENPMAPGIAMGDARSGADEATAGDSCGRSVFVHIGYQRTGTSFLQTHLFPRLAPPQPIRELPEIWRVGEHVGLNLERKFVAHAAPSSILFSCEEIAANVCEDLLENADNLKAAAPRAKILISIRSQYTIFRGVYFLYLKGGGRESYPKFVEGRAGKLFRYRAVVDRYRELFGKDNVFVFLQEDLANHPTETILALLTFLGEDGSLTHGLTSRVVKPSANDSALILMRWRNHLARPVKSVWPGGYRRLLHRGVPGHATLGRAFGERKFRSYTEQVRPLIRETYSEDNARLFESLGSDIRQYDYPRP